MTIDYRKLTAVNLVYCYIPVFLFLFGWCRWIIAFICSMLLIYLFYRLYLRSSQSDGKQYLVINSEFILCVVVSSFILSLFLGYGGMYAFFGDYEKHSAVVQDLFRYEWPVIYKGSDNPSMLTYYIGSYLLPALVGKLFGSRIVAEVALGIVGWIGMLLLFANILFLTKSETLKAQIRALIIYLAFYGMLFPLQALMSSVNTDVAFGDSQWFIFKLLQFRSAMVSLQWVWEQYTIPVLCLSMLYKYHEHRNLYALWILPALICGTWGFVALFLYAVADFFITSVKERKFYIEVFSWQNLLCILIGVIFVMYLAGSLTTPKPEDLKFHFITDWRYYLISYLPFCLFMFGFYFMLIWRGIYKDTFFYSTLFILCIIPFGRAGLYNDWLLGTSMPALFLLSIYCIKFLQNRPVDKQLKKNWLILVICLLLNVPYVISEIKAPLQFSGMPEYSLSRYSCYGCEDISIDLRTNYYTYNYEESWFYKYLARK